MILSAYRNPPYRAPMQRSTHTPPPHLADANCEPTGTKSTRKRKQTLLADSLPISKSDYQHVCEGLETGANSPRTTVAERLKDLDLRRHLTPELDLSSLKRKREREMSPDSRSGSEGRDVSNKSCVTEVPSSSQSIIVVGQRCNDTQEQSERSGQSSPKPPCLSSFAFERETMQIHQSREIQESPLILDDRPTKCPRREYHRTSAGATPSPSTKRAPRTQETLKADAPALTAREMVIDRAVSPSRSPLKDEESLTRAALTWQDDEITGHDIDTTTPDDDGEGINGIGFRPTPAMAYARTQKRRQQVHEWRAREAREARQKRMERRRCGTVSAPDSASHKARTVRFAPND